MCVWEVCTAMWHQGRDAQANCPALWHCHAWVQHPLQLHTGQMTPALKSSCLLGYYEVGNRVEILEMTLWSL